MTFLFFVRYLSTSHFTFTPGEIFYLTNTKNVYFQNQKKPCFLFPHLFSILSVAPLITQFSLLLAFINSRYLFQAMCHLACKEEPFPRKFQIFPIFVSFFSSVYSLWSSLLCVVTYFLLLLPKSLFRSGSCSQQMFS